MDVERWDTWLERCIVGLVAGALAFAVLAFGGVHTRDFLVVECLVGLALLLWGVRLWTVRSHRLLWPPVCWGVLVFVGWTAWRTHVADLPYIAWGEGMRVLVYAALFFVVVNNLHRQDTAQGLAWFLIGIATLLCFYGAWQFVSAGNTVWGLRRGEDYVHRASGSYFNPNHFAGLLGLLLPLGLAMVIAGRIKPLARILVAYAAIVMLVGLTLTLSRGGWLAVGIGLGGLLLVLARHRDYRWVSLGCLLVLLLGAGGVVTRSTLMKHRIEAPKDLDPQARNSRPQIWRATVAMWRDHPWLGVGPAHFGERFKQYRSMWAHGEPERAHNDYLNALADWGVAGTAAAALPWCLLAYGIRRTLRQVRRDPGDLEAKRSSRYAFVLGATAGLGVFLVHGLVDFNAHIPANAMVMVTWMALLSGYARYATDDWWASSSRPWRLGVTVVVLLPMLGLLGWDLARRGPETRHLDQARHARRTDPASDAELTHLKAAWQIEPRNPATAFAIGDYHRRRAFAGAPEHRELALEALRWFEEAARLNPYNPAYRSWGGLCLDWIGEHARAEESFQAALKLDPEGRITSFLLGWHELQKGDTAAAQRWFLKSVTQGYPPYPPAQDYLRILHERASSAPPAAPSGTPPAADAATPSAPPAPAPNAALAPPTEAPTP